MKKYNSLSYLNLFRILSCLLIAVICHSGNLSSYFNNEVFNFFQANSASLIVMFFLISGMCFYLAYYKKISNSKISCSDFLKRRVKKIYPLMIVAATYILIFNFVTSIVDKNPKIDLVNYISSITVGNSSVIWFDSKYTLNSPTWYIGCLMLCYLFALLLIFVQKKLKCKTKLIFIVPILLGLTKTFTANNYLLYNIHTSDAFIFFFLGFFLINFLTKFKSFKNGKVFFIKLICVFSIITLVLLLSFNVEIPDFASQRFSFKVLGFFLYIPLLILCYDVKWLNTICSTKPITILGKISFYIYIFNFPLHTTWRSAIDASGTLTKNMSGWFLLFDVALHIALGLIIYYLIEIKNKNLVKHK